MNDPTLIDLTVRTYIAYLTISIALTIWVAKTLHKNGRIFLVDSFLGDEKLADSVNHLLIVGFYLINIGYIALMLKYDVKVGNLKEVFEVLSTKIGLVLLILGGMHFFNIAIFSGMRKRALLQNMAPPVQPQEYLK